MKGRTRLPYPAPVSQKTAELKMACIDTNNGNDSYYSGHISYGFHNMCE